MSNQGTNRRHHDNHHHDVEGGRHHQTPAIGTKKTTNASFRNMNPNYDVSNTMSRLRESMVGGNDSSGLDHITSQGLLLQTSTPSPSQPFDLNENSRKNLDFRLKAGEEDSNSSTCTTPILSSNKCHDAYDTFSVENVDNEEREQKKNVHPTSCSTSTSCSQRLLNAFRQIPAVALIAMFHLMIGIPFGVSYFSIGWKEPTEFYEASTNSTNVSTTGTDVINGPFPIHGKNALGIRMFLFSTIIGQIVFTFKSGFHNPIGLQMVENVPFCQALTAIAIEHCGYGIEALSTLFVMFGLSSIIVGAVFYSLGKLELGRIIYFFPSHVMMGLIAGIGIFIGKTGVEVTINTVFSIESAFVKHLDLLSVVIFFELLLRILDRLNHAYGDGGKPFFSLLSPIFFCLITPIFYIALWALGCKVDDAEKNGYFFPPLTDGCSSSDCSSSSSAFGLFLESTIFNKDVLDMWRVIDFSVVSWSAIVDSIPTLVALTVFSLIHVPINIPAFAISTNAEYDMNTELISHGFSNCLSGCFGGLQNYFAYTQSILYHRSGGGGKGSGIAVAVVTTMLFFVGPTIASYIPRLVYLILRSIIFLFFAYSHNNLLSL